MDWTSDYFDQDYLSLYRATLNDERTRHEVDFLISCVFDRDTHKILDMPCGYGRHALLLAEREYRVHGVDNSPVMLERAEKDKQSLAHDAQDRVTFERADMRTFSAPGQFDATLNLFSSLGYFEDPAENEMVIENLCKSVRLDGLVVIDIRNLERDIAEFSATEWKKEDTENGIKVSQRLDPNSHKFTITYEYESERIIKKKEGTFQEYGFTELSGLLSRHGCRVEKTFGNFKGDSYNPESRKLIVVARRIQS